MIYGTTQPGVLITIIGFLIIWFWYRKEKKQKKEPEMEKQRREEESRHRNEEIKRQTEECRKRNEELNRERSAIRQSGMIPEAVFLTEDEIRLKNFCEENGGADITKDVIFKAWESLYNASKEERKNLIGILGERKGRKQTFYIAVDKEDVDRMKYCRISTTMDESSVYILGLELYKRQIS